MKRCWLHQDRPARAEAESAQPGIWVPACADCLRNAVASGAKTRPEAQ